MKNEAKYDEMIDIMMSLHKYVPSIQAAQLSFINEKEHFCNKDFLYPLFLGGDQMSAARYRGSAVIQSQSTTAIKRLEGPVVVNEDWHSQVTLLKVNYKSMDNFIFFFVQLGYMDKAAKH